MDSASTHFLHVVEACLSQTQHIQGCSVWGSIESLGSWSLTHFNKFPTTGRISVGVRQSSKVSQILKPQSVNTTGGLCPVHSKFVPLFPQINTNALNTTLNMWNLMLICVRPGDDSQCLKLALLALQWLHGPTLGPFLFPSLMQT
jgi:hypothetical protein